MATQGNVVPVTVAKLKGGPVLLIGCGDIGSAVGSGLRSVGREVVGLRRGAMPAGLPGLAVDYSTGEMRCLAEWDGDTALFTPVPAHYSEAGYRRGYVDSAAQLLLALEGTAPRRILLVSSTRVYGDQGGNWVDEISPLKPSDYAGKLIREAEQMLLQSHHQVSVIRFGGIYGRWPSRLLQRIQAGRIRRPEPVVYGNRIHRHDCVGLLLHLLAKLRRGESLLPCYLGVDDAPVSLWEVETWLASQLQVQTRAEEIPGRDGAGKRCRNTRLKESGYHLQYADYRAGYAPLLAELTPP